MEDTTFTKDSFNEDPDCGVFAVFDGHGGKSVSAFVKKRIPEELLSMLVQDYQPDLSKTLEELYLKVDAELKNDDDAEEEGSTGCLTLIRKEDGKSFIYIANIGDT